MTFSRHFMSCPVYISKLSTPSSSNHSRHQSKFTGCILQCSCSLAVPPTITYEFVDSFKQLLKHTFFYGYKNVIWQDLCCVNRGYVHMLCFQGLPGRGVAISVHLYCIYTIKQHTMIFCAFLLHLQRRSCHFNRKQHLFPMQLHAFSLYSCH